jgi:hypothetical protein
MSFLCNIAPVPHTSFQGDLTFVDLLPIVWFEREPTKFPPGMNRADAMEQFAKAHPPVIRFDKPVQAHSAEVTAFLAMNSEEKIQFLNQLQLPSKPSVFSSGQGGVVKHIEELVKDPRTASRLPALRANAEEWRREKKQDEEEEKKVVEEEKAEEKGKVGKAVGKKKKTIPKAVRQAVWITTFGKDVGMTKCPCCGASDISQMDFECGHIVAEANGGLTVVDNLRPICGKCNKSMGVQNMDEFKALYFSR